MNVGHASDLVRLEGLECEGDGWKVGRELEEMQTKECGLYSGNRDPLTTFVKGSDMVKAPFLGRLILQ